MRIKLTLGRLPAPSRHPLGIALERVSLGLLASACGAVAICANLELGDTLNREVLFLGIALSVTALPMNVYDIVQFLRWRSELIREGNWPPLAED